MKKTAIVLSTVTAVLFAVSCQKDNFNGKAVSGTDGFTPMTIKAESAGIGTVTRTELAFKYDVLWTANDRIFVKDASGNSDTFKIEEGAGTTKGTFTQEGSAVFSGEVEAFYPSTIVNDGNLAWPAKQTNDATIPMYCKKSLSGKTERMDFASLGSVLQIAFTTPQEDVILKSIGIKDGTATLSGAFSVNDGVAVITADDKAGITLDLGAEGIAVSNKIEYFYIAVPAGNYQDLTLVFTATDGKKCTMTGGKVNIAYNTVGCLSLAGTSFEEPVPTANCYVAKPGSTVTIPTCKGNSDEMLESDAASLIWQDNASLVKSVNLNGSKITVELNEAQEGNAVVAAKKGGVVVWSWTIWVLADEIKDVTVGSYTFMDRNVGALTLDEKSEKSIGVIYQYGRKDPFPGIKGYDTGKSTYVLNDIYNASGEVIAPEIKDNTEANNIENSIKNPQTFYKNYYVSGQKHNYSWITTDATTFDPKLFKSLWENNGVKSVYDPCPVGYKVASIAAWDAAKTLTVTEIWDDTYVTPDASAIGTNEKYVKGNQKKVQFRGCYYGDLKLTATGEVNANTSKDRFELSINNCVGKALPTAEVWCADIDPDFASKLNSSNFRGTAVKINTTGNGNYDDISAIMVNALSTAGKYGLNYALPVRCIKE